MASHSIAPGEDHGPISRDGRCGAEDGRLERRRFPTSGGGPGHGSGRDRQTRPDRSSRWLLEGARGAAAAAARLHGHLMWPSVAAPFQGFVAMEALLLNGPFWGVRLGSQDAPPSFHVSRPTDGSTGLSGGRAPSGSVKGGAGGRGDAEASPEEFVQSLLLTPWFGDW